MKKHSKKLLSLCLLILIFNLVACTPSLSQRAQSTEIRSDQYEATLFCEECAQSGIAINVWQNAGTSRGSVIFRAPHGTIVNVLDNKFANDGRTWFKVDYQGKIGWVANDFIKE